VSTVRRLIDLEDPVIPREVIPEGESMEIGRGSNVGLVIADRTVSRRHALIRRCERDLLLEDLGSTYGTSVNGRPMRKGQPVVLQDGDLIRLGQVEVVCRFEPEERDPASSLEDAAFAAQANARLLILEGGLARRLPLASPVTLIGSALHCEARLREPGGSPEEAVIRARDGAFRIEPRCAESPPRLNEEQIPLAGAIPLPTNTVILVRRAQILFLYDFGREGIPAPDPLSSIPRGRLLRHVAEQSGLSYRHLKGLCCERGVLGQSAGEILVDKGLVTPLFWRVLCARLTAHPSRGFWNRWKSLRPGSARFDLTRGTR
jgi:FHA domain-containing protein